MDGRIFRIPFCTALSASSQSKPMVVAVAEINGGTDEPAKVTSNGQYPVVCNGKVDIIVIATAETEVKFQTVGIRNIMLVRQFGTETGGMWRTDTTEAATDVLCVGSKGQAQDCDQDKQ